MLTQKEEQKKMHTNCCMEEARSE